MIKKGVLAWQVVQGVVLLLGATLRRLTFTSSGDVTAGALGETRARRFEHGPDRIFARPAACRMPGPVWVPRHGSDIALSWFVGPGVGNLDDRIAQAIQRLVSDGERLGSASEPLDLMQRLVAVGADLARDAIPAPPPELLVSTSKRRVLLIDQRHGATTAVGAHQRMVQAAQSESPDAEFWIWPTQGRSGVLLSGGFTIPAGTRQLSPGFSLFASLPYFARVYTVDAPDAMQALWVGVPLRVFGRPFYAGWGLTNDDLPMHERRARLTVSALFEAVYLRLTHYLDLETKGNGTLQQLLDGIALHRAVRSRFSDCEQLAGLRFQIWKRPFATPFLAVGGGRLRWTDAPDQIQPGERAVVWGGKCIDGLPTGTPVLRMEDGFFHSDGLGSDMNAPHSQVLDRHGLYFDARRPSELTHILNQACFDEAELERAAQLRVLACRLGVTKYNLGRRAPRWQVAANQRVLLVAGQVADDASIRFGTGALCTAEALLQTVRQRNPDAFIVYKPHPDVLSGNRNGLVHAQRFADVVDAEADVLSLIDRADEVHVLSSLAGFDALLRGKRVFTYGLPFYAGWGLTTDELEQPWRERSLTLDMLVAGTLLRYPLYWDWRTQMFTTPEAVVNLLGKSASRPLMRIAKDPLRWPRKSLRWSRNAVKHVLWAWQCKRRANL